jgi:hypothetical protein
MEQQQPTPQDRDLRVWWIPQIPGQPFYVPVSSPAEGKRVMDLLGRYDQFQFDNNIKGDYSNAGGLECFNQDELGTDFEQEWCEWLSDETGEDIHDTDEPPEQDAWSRD